MQSTFSHGRPQMVLIRRSAPNERSASAVGQGNAKYMRSKHVKLVFNKHVEANKLAKVWFSASSFKNNA